MEGGGWVRKNGGGAKKRLGGGSVSVVDEVISGDGFCVSVVVLDLPDVGVVAGTVGHDSGCMNVVVVGEGVHGANERVSAALGVLTGVMSGVERGGVDGGPVASILMIGEVKEPGSSVIGNPEMFRCISV